MIARVALAEILDEEAVDKVSPTVILPLERLALVSQRHPYILLHVDVSGLADVDIREISGGLTVHADGLADQPSQAFLTLDRDGAR